MYVHFSNFFAATARFARAVKIPRRKSEQKSFRKPSKTSKNSFLSSVRFLFRLYKVLIDRCINQVSTKSGKKHFGFSRAKFLSFSKALSLIGEYRNLARINLIRLRRNCERDSANFSPPSVDFTST